MVTVDDSLLTQPTELKERALAIAAGLVLAAEGFNQVTAGQWSLKTKELGESPIQDWKIGQIAALMGITKAKSKMTLSLSLLEAAQREMEEELQEIKPRVADIVASLDLLMEEVERYEKPMIAYRSLVRRLSEAKSFMKRNDTSYKSLHMILFDVKLEEKHAAAMQREIQRIPQLEKKLAALKEELSGLESIRPYTRARLEALEGEIATTNADIEKRKPKSAEERQRAAYAISMEVAARKRRDVFRFRPVKSSE